MRKLIVVKRGQLAVANRDVTELETDEAVNQSVAEMKAQFPDADLTWYRHTCWPACSEEVFTPKVKAAKPKAEAEDKDGVLIEKAPAAPKEKPVTKKTKNK